MAAFFVLLLADPSTAAEVALTGPALNFAPSLWGAVWFVLKSNDNFLESVWEPSLDYFC